MTKARLIENYIDGKWIASTSTEIQDVINPANQDVLAKVPLSTKNEINHAVEAASTALIDWRDTPATERVQYLFKLKTLFEENLDELARTITLECGKTLAESKGELQRAIENIEVACGIPSMLMGSNLENIARGIDEHMIRQPIGVVGIITPFNFPGMIPFWFLPYAIACGNSCIIKPSEKVPLTMVFAIRLLEKTGLPKGIVNLVNGGKETVDAMLDHPQIKAISFVGSSEVAKYIYSRGAANGKRVQAQGGAKNPVVIMPDADPEMTTQIIADSAFGCAGQRCLANSLVITVAEAKNTFSEAICEAATNRVLGSGFDKGVQVGPVINADSKERIQSFINNAHTENAKVIAGGHAVSVKDYEQGNFVAPTVIDNVNPEGNIATSEIFGPVLGLMHANTLEEAIAMVNKGRYGNMGCIFTNSGPAARKFRNQVDAGNIGINIGVAAPMAFFPFSGWNESFYGDLHAQGAHAIEFYTQTKVIAERWPKEWSRTF
ncbi:MAG: CoA-acylating methylmalonate-semialdehyde dehydrogenase [Gammaproteobacteria bacterium]|nr:CoA-acylating methylmalonate-semialdehyde dehydrogenase [Gammaproteobacteria bacterium]